MINTRKINSALAGAGVIIACLAGIIITSRAPSEAGAATAILKTSTNEDGTLTITGMESSEGDTEVIIPDEYKGARITAVSKSAFAGLDNIISVSLGENLESIEESAFADCTGIKSVSLPESLESIGPSAFMGCSRLSQVSFPENIEYICMDSFYGTAFEKKAHSAADNGFLLLGGYILYDFIGASENITVPDGVRIIADGAFTYPENDISTPENPTIKTVTCPDSVEIICDHAFNGCVNIKNITLGSGIKSIGADSFQSASATVHGYIDSYAQSFAENNGYEFSPLIPKGEYVFEMEQNENVNQYYFSDGKFDSKGAKIFKRSWTGEKTEVQWELEGNPKDYYNRSKA